MILTLACGKFRFNKLDLGDIGGIPRLRRDVGNGLIRDLLLSGRSVGAKKALAVGLIAVNVTRPGVGVVLPAPDPNAVIPKPAPTTFGGFLEHVVPQSFFEAAAQNEVLQIVFFAIIFAVSLARVEGPSKKVMLDWLQSLSEIMFKFVGIVMAYAPIGIGAAIGVSAFSP